MRTPCPSAICRGGPTGNEPCRGFTQRQGPGSALFGGPGCFPRGPHSLCGPGRRRPCNGTAPLPPPAVTPPADPAGKASPRGTPEGRMETDPDHPAEAPPAKPPVAAPGIRLRPPVWHVVLSHATVRAPRGGLTDRMGLPAVIGLPSPLGPPVPQAPPRPTAGCRPTTCGCGWSPMNCRRWGRGARVRALPRRYWRPLPRGTPPSRRKHVLHCPEPPQGLDILKLLATQIPRCVEYPLRPPLAAPGP